MPLSQPELLRHVNQEIENLWLSRLRTDDELPVVCECSDPSCALVVSAPLAVFREAVADGLFLVIAGHLIDGRGPVRNGDGWELLAPGQGP